MKIESVEIENYRAIEKLTLPLDPSLTVLHGDNTCGKTSVLGAIAVGLGVIPDFFPSVSGTDFVETDMRVGESFVHVGVSATDGLNWTRERFGGTEPEGSAMSSVGLDAFKQRLADLALAAPPVDLPIVAFYDTDRAMFDGPDGQRASAGDVRRYAMRAVQEEALLRIGRSRSFPRSTALEGALAARTNFPELFLWFYARENDELREQKQRKDFTYRRNDLTAVRRAIASMLKEVSDPRVEMEPLRFSVSSATSDGRSETLELDQLSDGQRAVLALAADLAWRMAVGNPHLDDPLGSEAVVLIDEVELHLHPSWQQRILKDLRRTFPNTQFIVSTHSPQVLTTVEPEHIVELAREGGRIVAGSATGWTYGAEAGDVLSAVMGVNERPVNDFTETLGRYARLVSEGRGESEDAVALRATLERLSPEDPALARADLEIRQRRLFEEMAKSR